MSKSKFTLGADPEAFIYDTVNKRFVPSCEHFKGTKNEAESFGEGFGVLCDNLMVEFNIPPSDNKADFVANLNIAVEHINSKLPKGMELRFTEQAMFDDEALQAETAWEFGCAAQSNLYNLELLPSMLMDEHKRFAGGHIHFGVENPKELDLPRLIKCFDLFVGLPLFLDREDETSTRVVFYGAPGTYRKTPYGFEYRTPSNEWVNSNESISWVYDQVVKAYEIYSEADLELPTDEEIHEGFKHEAKGLKLIKKYLIAV